MKEGKILQNEKGKDEWIRKVIKIGGENKDTEKMRRSLVNCSLTDVRRKFYSICKFLEVLYSFYMYTIIYIMCWMVDDICTVGTGS